MPNTPQPLIGGAFDPRAFLCRNGSGKTIEHFAKNQKVFSQGDIADAVFFIQTGRSRSLCCPSRQGGGGRDFRAGTVLR